jgi:hypothetical protein
MISNTASDITTPTFLDGIVDQCSLRFIAILHRIDEWQDRLASCEIVTRTFAQCFLCGFVIEESSIN